MSSRVIGNTLEAQPQQTPENADINPEKVIKGETVIKPIDKPNATQTSLLPDMPIGDGFTRDDMLLISGLSATTVGPYESKGKTITLKLDKSGTLADGRAFHFYKGTTFKFNQKESLWVPEK